MSDLMTMPVAGILRGSSQMFEDVDTVLGRAIAAGDPLIALEHITTLQKEGMMRGLAIAKMFYRIRQNWSLFERAGVGDSFESLVEAQNGYAPATVEKYVRMWEKIFENSDLSEDLKDKLSGRPIGDLLLLTAAASEGSLGEEEWKEIVIAPDTNRVREVVRNARGDVTSSKNAIFLSVIRRTDSSFPPGTLVAYCNGESEVIGQLKVGNLSELGARAQASIINRARIEEK